MNNLALQEDWEDETHRQETIQKLEESSEPGARLVLKVLRRVETEEGEAVMWGQNWNAHSRSK